MHWDEEIGNFDCHILCHYGFLIQRFWIYCKFLDDWIDSHYCVDISLWHSICRAACLFFAIRRWIILLIGLHCGSGSCRSALVRINFLGIWVVQWRNLRCNVIQWVIDSIFFSNFFNDKGDIFFTIIHCYGI